MNYETLVSVLTAEAEGFDNSYMISCSTSSNNCLLMRNLMEIWTSKKKLTSFSALKTDPMHRFKKQNLFH